MGEFDRRESDMLLARLEEKLSGIEGQLNKLWEANDKAHQERSELYRKIDEYTSHWKAVRNIGAFFVAVVLLVKTGDASALKALFTFGP